LLGDARLAAGDMRGAERSLKEASTRYARLAMSAGQADVWMTLGLMHQQRGALHASKDALERARDTYRRLQDRPNEARAMNRLGEVALRLGRWREARSIFEQSVQLHRRLGEPLGATLAATCIGSVALAPGAVDEARAIVDRVRDDARAFGVRGMMARVERLAMRVALTQGRLEDAEHARHRAIELYAQARDDRGIAHVWLAMGEECVAARDMQRASQAYAQALAMDGAHLSGDLTARLEALRVAVVDATSP
ncbi:MAG: tetratricopeptide repeat protein, partial [Myxococcota bacterium]